MKSDSSSRSGLLLMEIILAILFFSLISALCLQVFVKAHTLSQDTRKLDAAVRQADSVASVLLAVPEPEKSFRRFILIPPWTAPQEKFILIRIFCPAAPGSTPTVWTSSRQTQESGPPPTLSPCMTIRPPKSIMWM